MAETQSPLKIFLTGATGYIGGAVLTKLLEVSQARNWEITALVRSETAAKKLQGLGVIPLIGYLDDSELLTKAAADSNVIINTADSFHLPAVKALVKGASSEGKRRILIHTAGTGILADYFKGNVTSDKIYSDLDVEAIRALPLTQVHSEVCKYIFENSQGFEIIIVAPPTVYGLNKGPFHPHSQQIPAMIQLFLHRGEVATAGKGLNIWNHVHIEDLADLYFLLIEKTLKGQASTGHEGWYFCESGEHLMKDLTAKIGEELFKQGAIKKPEPIQVKEGEEEAYFGPLVWVGLASNSRCRADRARALGWVPKRKTFYESLGEEVKAIITSQKTGK